MSLSLNELTLQALRPERCWQTHSMLLQFWLRKLVLVLLSQGWYMQYFSPSKTAQITDTFVSTTKPNKAMQSCEFISSDTVYIDDLVQDNDISVDKYTKPMTWFKILQFVFPAGLGWLAQHEPEIIGSLTNVNSSPPSAAYMHQWTGSALVQVMACRLFGAKPLSEPMLPYCQLDP